MRRIIRTFVTTNTKLKPLSKINNTALNTPVENNTPSNSKNKNKNKIKFSKVEPICCGNGCHHCVLLSEDNKL